MSDIPNFPAKDAFVYVENYRRLILLPPSRIEVEKQRLEERYWNAAAVPPHYYAELRAHEHALEYALKRTEPEMVVLGDEAKWKEEAQKGELQRAAERALQEQELKRLRDELGDAQRIVRVAQQREAELQAEIVQKAQQHQRLERKLSQTYSTFVVVTCTLLVVILAMFAIYLT